MIGKSTKKAFVTGLAALLPTAITIWLLVKVYEMVANTIGSLLTTIMVWTVSFLTGIERTAVAARVPPVVGVVLAVVLVFFLGLMLASLIGRRTWGVFERQVLTMPIIRLIYPSLKQITDFIFSDRKVEFRHVVLVEYPRKGVYAIAFVTGQAFSTVNDMAGEDMVTLFIPSSPTPFTGYCIQVARREIIQLDVSVDAALRYVMSGGVILPPGEGGHAVEQHPPPIAGIRGGEDGLAREDGAGSQE